MVALFGRWSLGAAVGIVANLSFISICVLRHFAIVKLKQLQDMASFAELSLLVTWCFNDVWLDGLYLMMALDCRLSCSLHSATQFNIQSL